jgi:hypothetical protein
MTTKKITVISNYTKKMTTMRSRDGRSVSKRQWLAAQERCCCAGDDYLRAVDTGASYTVYDGSEPIAVID